MQLVDIETGCLDIPFKVHFKHAACDRSRTESVWVLASTRRTTGFGEACPRHYVTGETVDTAEDFIRTHEESLRRMVHDLPSMTAWMDEHQAVIDDNPAAWCALELALLDAMARERGESIDALLSLPELKGDFRYTAVLGDMEMDRFTAQVERYRALGFDDYKIKLTGDLARDQERLRTLVRTCPSARIRGDANNLWSRASEAIHHLERLPPLFALEEPLRARDYGGMTEIASGLGLKIVLDESFLGPRQLPMLRHRPGDWIVNVRVSKMGGILRSLRLLEKLEDDGIDCLIGAQVGETSCLTRAALSLANPRRETLLALEGAFGTYLLERDVCSPVLMFGPGGLLDRRALAALGPSGLGLDYDLDGIRHRAMPNERQTGVTGRPEDLA